MNSKIEYIIQNFSVIFLITEKMTVKTMDGLLIKTEKKATHNLIKNESYIIKRY